MVSHDGQCEFKEVKQVLRLPGRMSVERQVLNSGALIGNPAAAANR